MLREPLLSAMSSLAGTFTLDLSPHNAENVNTTLSGSSLSYSSPTTTSLGAPQEVTLFYSSSHAAPRGFVQVDVADVSGTPPEKYSIRLTNSANAAVTFTNGVQESFYVGGSGTTRLAAQFDASGLSTGLHAYTVSVRKWSSGAVYDEATAAVKVIVVNERTSPYGAGWSVAGAQRLTVAGDDALLVDGSGRALAFRRTGPGAATFTTPAGDFSKLVELPGSTGYRRTTNDSTRHYFSSVGRLDSVVDRFGLSWRYGYDGGGKLARIATPAGRRDTLVYDGSGRISQIKDPTNRAVTLTVDGSGDLVSAVDADAVTGRSIAYDAAHRISHWLNRGGARSDVSYDTAGTVQTVTAPTITADGASVRPATGFRSLETTLLPATGTGVSLATAATRVQPADARTRVTDPRGKVSHTTLDRFGNPVRIDAPLGQTTIIDRNAHSQVTRTVSHPGHTVWYDWTGLQLTRVRDATLGDTVHYEYDAYDQPTRTYGTNTPETRNHYSGPGRLDSVRLVATNRVVRLSYTTFNLLASTRDPEDHVTAYTYDGTTYNLLEVETGSTGQRKTTYRYDAYGRTVAVVNPEGERDSVVYDLLDRRRKSFNAAGDSVLFTYTDTHLSQVRDPIGQTYGFSRNALGMLVSETDPRGQTTHYRYDRNGNRTAVVNRRGQVVGAAYDDLNRLLWQTDSATSATTTFVYDSAGLWTMTSNAHSRDTTFLDAAGRTTSVVTVRGGTRYVLSSGYDRRSLRTSLTMTAPWSRSIGYRYNAEMQLDTVTDVNGGKTSLTYNDDGALVDTRYPTILQAQTSVPSSHLPSGTYYTALGVAPLTHGILQDMLGRISERWDAGEDTATAYTYDARGALGRALTFAYEPVPLCEEPTTSTFDPDFGLRVAPAVDPDCEGFIIDQEDLFWQYDAVGNPTSGMDTGNRLLSSGGYTMQYDADGNLTSKSGNGKTQTFTWDGMGQLTSVTTNSATTSYAYDGAGQRVRKVTPTDTTVYLYDGDDLFMELSGSGAIRREYTYFPGVDQPHSVRQGGQMYYYMTEGPGNVVGLVNSSNQLVNRYRYDPFGNPTLTTETVGNPLRFTGREYDAESGLYFYRARYYDPEARRFISEDPIGLEGGINPYAYAGNDPVNNRDPSGLSVHMMTSDYRDLLNRVDSRYPDFNQLTGGPPRVGGGNRKDPKPRVSVCGRKISKLQCDLIFRAISALEDHEHDRCQKLGEIARDYMLTGRSYYDKEVRVDELHVKAGEYQRATGTMMLTWSGMRPGHLMDTLAHEMWHMIGKPYSALLPGTRLLDRRHGDDPHGMMASGSIAADPLGATAAGNQCRGPI